MNEFKRYRLIEEYRECHDILDESVKYSAPKLVEALKEYSYAVEIWENYIIAEALTPDEVTKILQAVETSRGEGTSSLRDKGKSAVAGVKSTMDKGKELAGNAAKGMAQVKSKLKDIASSGKAKLPKKYQDMLDAGGEQAKSLIDSLDAKVEDQISTLGAKLANVPGGNKLIGAAQEIGELANKHPKSTAFALAALTAIGTAASGGMAAPALGALAKGAVEMMKGEKFSTAVGKGLKTAAIGGGIGAGADMLGDVAGDALADMNIEAPDSPEIIEVPDTPYKKLRMDWTVNGRLFSFDMLLTPEEYDAAQKMMNGDASTAEQLTKLTQMQLDPEQLGRSEELQRIYNQQAEAGSINKVLKDIASDQMDDYKEAVASTKQLSSIVSGAAGGAAAGAADSRSAKRTESVVPQQRTRNHELDRIRELAGLPPLNEGPKWDAVKKGAGAVGRVGKDLAQSSKQAIKGSSAVKASDLQAAWDQEHEAGKPADEEVFKNFLRKQGITDKEIRNAMKAVPGSDVQLDPKSQERLEKMVTIINRLDIKDDILAHINISATETTESIIYEEIKFPNAGISPEAVVDIFNELEKQLPKLKQAGQEAEEPASNDYSQDGAVSPTSVSMNPTQGKQRLKVDANTNKAKGTQAELKQAGYKIGEAEVIKIINKLVEHHMLGRMRR